MDIKSRFEEFNIEDIRRYITEKKEENISLEFKVVNCGSLNSRDDKRNYAKALSGFANSSGGLLVWGVDARKNKDGVDCATEIAPIENVRKFLTRLIELENDAVTPCVDGVNHKILEIDNGKGYAITYIPESVRGPHMAKLGEFRYYKRSGDSFYVMEHFDIEDMFGRRKKPKLDLSIIVSGKGNRSNIILGLENTGRGSAKAPYLAFLVPEPFIVSPYGVDGNGATGLNRIRGRGNKPWIEFGGNSQIVIHPDTILEVTSLHQGLGSLPPDPPKEGVVISYRIASEDMALIENCKHVYFDLT